MVESPPGDGDRSSHLATLIHLFRYAFLSYETFSFLNRSTFYFNRIYVNRLNYLVCHSPVDTIVKPQVSSPNKWSARQQRFLKQQEIFYLQDELAEVIRAHPQEMYCAAYVRLNE